MCRCDQRGDCDDISDEKGCAIVIVDPKNYMKDKPPQEVIVKLRVELLKILEIDEVGMLYRTQYIVNQEWLDLRLTFHNLHHNQQLNTLIEEENLDVIFGSESWERDNLILREIIKLESHTVISNVHQ